MDVTEKKEEYHAARASLHCNSDTRYIIPYLSQQPGLLPVTDGVIVPRVCSLPLSIVQHYCIEVKLCS